MLDRSGFAIDIDIHVRRPFPCRLSTIPLTFTDVPHLVFCLRHISSKFKYTYSKVTRNAHAARREPRIHSATYCFLRPCTEFNDMNPVTRTALSYRRNCLCRRFHFLNDSQTRTTCLVFVDKSLVLFAIKASARIFLHRILSWGYS